MKRALLWACRIAAAGILLSVGYQKLVAAEMASMIFELLGMEPHGRVIIGLVEVSAALLLLSPQAAIGALLAVGVMFGAIIAHLTVLGVEVGDDGGRMLMMLGVVFMSSTVVLVARARELPVIGSSFDGTNRWSP